MEEYFRPLFESDEDFDQTRFSGFVELQKTGVKQALQQAGFGISDFARWLKDGQLRKLEGVRSLPKVLKNVEARKVFLRDGMAEAEKLIDRPDLSKTLRDASVEQLTQALSHKLRVVPYPEVISWRQDPTLEVVGTLLTLRDVIGSLVDEDEPD